MKKNNTAAKTALKAQQIAEALKEGTQQSLQGMLNEAIAKAVMEAEDKEEKEDAEAEDAEDDTYEVEDADAATEDGEDGPVVEEPAEGDGEEGTEETGDDDDWSDLEDYKVGDDAYDFSGEDEDSEALIKAFQALGDDDKIFVRSEGDGDFELEGDGSGTELEIHVEGGEDADATLDGEENIEDEPEGEEDFELELDDDGPEEAFEDEGETEFEIEPDEDGDDAVLDVEDDDDEDIELELNEEDLGYTTEYQKDVMPGLSVSKGPNKGSYEMDKGVPKGNGRPWSGYKKEYGDPFVNEDVNECGELEVELEEGATTTSTQPMAKTTKNHPSQPRKEHARKVSKVISTSKDGYTAKLQEKVEKMYEYAKAIKEQNEAYEKAINEMKSSVREAALSNVKLRLALKLLQENTTTQEQKKSIPERFANVNSVNECVALCESIQNELNNVGSTPRSIVSEMTAQPAKAINEQVLYSNTKEEYPQLQLMERMENLPKSRRHNYKK